MLNLPVFGQVERLAVDGGPPLTAPELASAAKSSTMLKSSADAVRKEPSSESPPFNLGEGLPTVPAKVVRKIERGEYIDMAELLRDNIEADRRREGRELPGGEAKRLRREVPDLLSWVQCFSMFSGVVARQHPERTKELFAYLTMVVREARRCGGSGWREYDAMFRQLAASGEVSDWAKLNPSIYAVSFLAQSVRGKMCPHCLEPDHAAEMCALAPKRAEPIASRPLPPYPPAAPARSQGLLSRRRSDQVCFSWNEGKCAYPYCRYRHVCLRCQGEHRSWQCRMPPTPSPAGGRSAAPGPRVPGHPTMM